MIAIIGMGCRYPEAANPRILWQNLCAGRQSFAPVDPRRWDHSRFSGPNRVAHLERVDLFAASHFRIAPRRAEVMDPQQRLLLEVAWETIHDAGLGRGNYDCQRSAAFVGCSLTEYQDLCTARLRERQMLSGQFGTAHDSSARTQRVAGIRSYTLPGNMMSMNASVIAQFFDWGGPALALDGACASSLLAVDQACRYLLGQPRRERAPVALAAGVYLNFVPDNLVAFDQMERLGEGSGSAFDVHADGFVLGEGIGAVLLKRLEDALRDGDRVYAVIRGSVCNSDGASSGQSRLLREGLRQSGYAAAELGYLECHGAAKPEADAIELAAWSEVLAGHRPWVGSVKANLGHSLSAAGIAGLMRASLAVYHACIPPHAGFTGWNPELVNLSGSFRVPAECVSFPGQIRRASVSSFAFGGSNCVLFLESLLPVPIPEARRFPVVLSAPSPELMDDYCGQLLEMPEQPLNYLAYTLTMLRPRQKEARLIWAASHEDYRLGLAGWRNLPLAEPEDWNGYFEEVDRRVAELPPPVLARTSYWVISKQTREHDGQRERELREWLARTCGCSPQDLRPGQRLVEDLGLDSMALRDLLTLLPSLPEAEPVAGWTVGDLLTRPGVSEAGFSECKLHPSTHPYLLDAAQGPVLLLPLGNGLDLVARGLDLQPPWSLQQVCIHRWLMFREQAEVSVRQREDRAELETGGGQILLSAEIGLLGRAPLPLELDADWEVENWSSDGICQVLAIGEQGLVATVKTSLPREWIPGDPRSRWHLDPLVLNSCLELAGHWAFRKHGRHFAPTAIGEVTRLTNWSQGTLEVHLRARADGERPAADALLYQEGRLVGWIRNLQSRPAKAPRERSWQALPAEWKRSELLPEVVEMQARLKEAGADNPYFRVLPPGDVNFCRYNYVGLALHPQVLEAACQALTEYGCTTRSSRRDGGELPLHRDLERALATFLGHQDGLVMVGGHATNTAVLSSWMQAPDLILHDSLSHNSILEGAQASGARRLSFPHNDMAALEAMLEKIRTRFRRVLLVVEGIYSMDGDIAPLPDLLRLKERYGCLLMIDEAHSLGVLGRTGRGVCEHFEVDASRVDLLMGTLSKTLGSCGGYLVGESTLIEYFRYQLPGFVHSAGLAPPLVASAREALRLLEREPQRVERLRSLSRQFWEACRREGMPLGSSQGTPVVPIILGDSQACTRLCAEFAARGIQVKPIVYPAVEESAARLRFFLSHEHTPEQLARAFQVLCELLLGARVGQA